MAVLVVCVGLFGVLAYAVARRTREIGVRIALGATRGNVRWLVVRQSLLTVAFGVLAGLLVAMYAARTAAPMLYGVTPSDPGTLATAVGLLVAVGVAAAYVPAYRATRVDPMIALRAE